MFVASREKAGLGELVSSDPWEETAADQNRRVWNDDCSNILGALREGG